MNEATKIITLIGGVIGVASAIGLITGINKVRQGLSHDDDRTTDKGVTQIVISGAMLVAVGGLVAYAITQLNAITF
ncbi:MULTISPECIES: type III secretion system protein PrgF [Lactococcus]|uniref:type III secretion system protein PrgF n=1 Tax=Lactococcus TaxID=1357 RepID=UPI00254CF3E1|nr:type III secretion system protein PrgF [Lactococcus formosensis]